MAALWADALAESIGPSQRLPPKEKPAMFGITIKPPCRDLARRCHDLGRATGQLKLGGQSLVWTDVLFQQHFVVVDSALDNRLAGQQRLVLLTVDVQGLALQVDRDFRQVPCLLLL
nr:hypothetical protein GCM10020185_21800 [Pseudomonas brassicacearum subsp. brassicacearum]